MADEAAAIERLAALGYSPVEDDEECAEGPDAATAISDDMNKNGG